jgi:ppGpp synthetase/RelA/SpoT-type nucleotidyltranferase
MDLKAVTFTKTRVQKAGEAFREFDSLIKDEKKFNETMNVLSYWRLSHENPLNEAYNILQNNVLKHDKKAFFAKRLKRYEAIVKKLKRLKTNLSTMQDIGGCRAIVESEKKVFQSMRELKKHKNFRDDSLKRKHKDYISSPKEDGYRGYHLIGKFPYGHGDNRVIEIQIRTRIQHYWATALEVVDLFTGRALKSNEGDSEWRPFFADVGTQFSVMDRIHLFHQKNKQDQFKYYVELLESNKELQASSKRLKKTIKSIKATKKLSGFNNSIKSIDDNFSDKFSGPENSYCLLKINIEACEIRSFLFPFSKMVEAEQNYIEAEKEAALSDDLIVALVASDAVGGIKQAYPNYFANLKDFLQLLKIVEQY